MKLGPPSASEAGATLLGKYQLGRLLGRGSFAKVYQARRLADDATVAVKIIDKAKTVDAAMEPRIICEVDAMRRLQHHPNILKIHEVMATKSKIYLVMEFAAGGELFGKIFRRGKMTEAVARRYFWQMVSALSFCHQNGVAHRDVKPQNLLLDAQGNLKVSDFGLSALPDRLKNGLLHTACGTPAYTAPEVVARRGYDGGKADSWSCGVILFVLLSGSLPFDDRNLSDMYKKIHRREFQLPDWISKSARNLIFRLLDPNPNSRMGTEEIMKHPWFKKTNPSKMKCVDGGNLLELVKNRKVEIGVPVMNAFDIISMSSGLDLSGLFETVAAREEKRFTTSATVEEVEKRVSEIAGELGYRVERGQGGAIGLGKGRVALVVEVLEMAPSLLMVEVKVVEAVMEFEQLHWANLKAKLMDMSAVSAP